MQTNPYWWISGCLGRRDRESGEEGLQRTRRKVLGWWMCSSASLQWWWVCPYRKRMKLCALNVCGLLYVNYTSRELFLKASCMHFSPIFTDLWTAFGKSVNFLLFAMLLSPGFQDIASRSLPAFPHRQSEANGSAWWMRWEFWPVDFKHRDLFVYHHFEQPQ